jgi:hypothetical protein
MSPLPDLPDADAIAAAVATCPSVSGLSGGIAGEIATYLPGRRVSGIRTRPGSVEVHVITKYGSPLHDVDAEVRAAVQAAVPGPLQVDVVLADVEDPFAPEPEPEPRAIEAGPSATAPALEPAGAVPVPGNGPTSPAGTSSPAAGPASSSPTTGTPTTGTPTTGTPTSGPPAGHVPPPPTAP